MNNNPFLNFEKNPKYNELSSTLIDEAIDEVINQANQVIATVVENSDFASWDTVCQPLEESSEKILRVWNQIEHMVSVNSSEQWRAAHQANLPKIAHFFTSIGQNEGLYKQLCAVQQSSDFNELSLAKQKVINDAIRDFSLSGVSLPTEQKQLFLENEQNLAMLSAKFEENLLIATEAFTLLVENEDELGNMPDDLKGIAQEKAEATNQNGWCFGLHAPSYLAVMKYVTNTDIREKMYHAFSTRASEFGKTENDNQPIIDEIVKRRRDKADLLDFAQYSDLVMKVRMAKKSDVVLQFLQNLAQKARPYAQEEMAQLKKFAYSEYGIDDLKSWDTAYVSEKLRKDLFDYSESDLKQYLPKDNILKGLFQCIEKMLNVQIRESQAPIWHDDAVYYEVISNDKVIGGLYLDLYARDGKRGGAWMADVLSRFYCGNHLQQPVAHVVCNFAKSISGPSLLNWDDVVTLFHEFGHAMHHLLTEVDEFSISGISGVEWDAVELPSQWLENFVWDWDVISSMTAHIETGESMPKELFNKLLNARYFQSGLWLARQLEFALFDFLLHSDNTLSPQLALAKARTQAAVLQAPEYNRFPCGFSHVFAGGYASGYYSYLWAEVLAADIFTMFRESDCLLNRELGERFKQQVLSVGGSRSAMESFVAMRGREPDEAILLAHYGLTA